MKYHLNYKSQSYGKLPKPEKNPKFGDLISIRPMPLSAHRVILPTLNPKQLKSSFSPSSAMYTKSNIPTVTFNSLNHTQASSEFSSQSKSPAPVSPQLQSERIVKLTKNYESILANDRIVECAHENVSDESYISDHEAPQPTLSISSADLNKFTSQPNRLDSIKKSTVSSLMSDRSLMNLPSSRFSSLRHQSTISNILEEMNSTNNVSVYNELKTKLMTKDPILEGTHGNIFRWKVVEVVGSGSFGQVLKIIDVNSGKIFAIKKLYFNPGNPQQLQFIDALQQEMKILQKLKNPHIVEYKGCEKIDETYCMYTEFLSGGSLSKLVYKLGPLPENTVKAYTRQILKGLLYLHSNGVIHRDLKGHNILLDSNGKLKLCDFGAAKRYENDINESGLVTSAKGSLPWMAPEVMKQSGYGRKADVWSLGCCVLEMLTGKAPWSGVENQVALMMKMLVYSETPEIPKHASAAAKDFVQKCLARDPEKRPTTMELLTHSFVNIPEYKY